ncbi:MAG: glycosyltransferase [Butyrivibrio sp.]
MDKKLIFLADYRAKLDNKNTLIIHSGSNDDNMRDAVVTAVMDGKEVPVTIERRDTVRSRFCYRDKNIFFSCEYQFLINVTDDFKKLNLTVKFRDELKAPEAGISISGKRFRAFVNEVRSVVDKVERKDNKVIISGWAADDEDIDIRVYDGKKLIECECIRAYRKDITDYYLEGEYVLPAGFELKLDNPKTNRVKIVFSTPHKSTVHHVNLKYETGQKSLSLFPNLKKAWGYNKQYGFRIMMQKAVNKLFGSGSFDYNKWIKEHQASDDELASQRNTKFPYEPLFSIVVPVYKPDNRFFADMLKSVLSQTYSNWELCIADGGNTVEKTVKEICKGDTRVKYKALDQNFGISGNTNEALDMAVGDYIVLGDHDDIIRPDALFECASVINKNPDTDVIYSDEDKLDTYRNKRVLPNFKPDYSPDYLRCINYICHLFVFSRRLYEKVGKFNSEFDGAQDYDMILRCCEQAAGIVHIPKILYSWRIHGNSTAGNPESKRYAFIAGQNAIKAHLDRVGLKADISEVNDAVGLYRVKYRLDSEPKISILIPNKDHHEDLDKCIRSIVNRQDYNNYEIIVIENNSVEDDTFKYYNEIEKEFDCIKIVYYEGGFNYSKINNFGVKYATGEYLLLLNNDTEMIGTDCLRELMSYGIREDVGIVGAKLLYEDDTVQHAGVIMGLGSLAGHAFVNNAKDDGGYQSRANIPQNLSAVTAACLLTRKSVYEEVGGLEEDLQVAFNDVDYCMKVRDKNYLVVYNPYALLHHYESKSRGYEDTREKIERFEKEATYLNRKWEKIIREGDPYYNVNLTLSKSDFSLRE